MERRRDSQEHNMRSDRHSSSRDLLRDNIERKRKIKEEYEYIRYTSEDYTNYALTAITIGKLSFSSSAIFGNHTGNIKKRYNISMLEFSKYNISEQLSILDHHNINSSDFKALRSYGQIERKIEALRQQLKIDPQFKRAKLLAKAYNYRARDYNRYNSGEKLPLLPLASDIEGKVYDMILRGQMESIDPEDA